MNLQAPAALGEACEPGPGTHIPIADALAHGAEQDQLQLAAMDRNLRPAISRR
jgi:hypothetical protein